MLAEATRWLCRSGPLIHPGLGRPAQQDRHRTACATPTAWPSRRPPPSPTSSASMPRSSPASATCRSSPTCPASSPSSTATWCATSSAWACGTTSWSWTSSTLTARCARSTACRKRSRLCTPRPLRVETQWLVEAAARRQKWIDQAQSLNIYMAGASGKKLDETYKLAWLRGLKTTYYLRTQSATHAEKSTVTAGKMNAVSSSTDHRTRQSMSALDAARHASAAIADGISARDRHQVLCDRRSGLRSLPVSQLHRLTSKRCN
jgi:hypothetical protein